jgi:hypothetical protein
MSRAEEPERRSLSSGLRWILGIAGAVIGIVCLGVAVLGAIDSFTTVRKVGEPWLGARLDWTLPVVTDAGIFGLLAADLLIELLAKHELIERGLPFQRWVAWGFVAGTVYLNVSAANGNPHGIVAHAAGPVAFVVMAEGVRMMIRRWTGLAGASALAGRLTGLKLKWLALFGLRGFRLWRRSEEQAMMASYLPGVRLEHDRLARRARIRGANRGWRHWRARRLAMRLESAAAILGDPQPAAGRPASGPSGRSTTALAPVPAATPLQPRRGVPGGPAALPGPAGQAPAAAVRKDQRTGGRSGGDRAYGELAASITQALRGAAGADGAAHIHELLAERDDYPAIIRWAATQQPRGYKRLMALVALYATGSRTEAGMWILSLVPGPDGRVDRNEIRAMARRLEAAWQERSYPPGAAQVPADSAARETQ